MDVLQAVLLGIIQGLTEFLPVSSSGHLLLAQKILHVPEPSLTLSILLHLGTLAAVFVVFWRDWWQMIRNPFKSRVFWMLVLATIPAGIAAILLNTFLKEQSSANSSGIILGASFLFTAVLLFVAEWWSTRYRVRGRHRKKMGTEDVGVRQALTMGCMQAIGTLPGVSRSGSTIVGGLFAGLDRPTAAKFSFMMSVPAVLGSLIFDVKDLLEGPPGAAGGWLAPLVGIVVAGTVGYVAIRWMLRLLERVSLRVFGIYVAVLGLWVLLDSLVFHLYF